MRRILFSIFCMMIALAAARAGTARAADLSVTPAVIDDHGIPRDILNYTLIVKNNADHPVSAFATVRDLTADGTLHVPSQAVDGRAVSLSGWISISRGGLLWQPGETKTFPLNIQISPFAVAGVYHATVAFPEGGTRDEAEKNPSDAGQSIITLTVASNAKESLLLKNFGTARRWYSQFPAQFHFTIQNVGNTSSTPTGSITFYDRIGHMMGAASANPGAATIPPGAEQSFDAVWRSDAGFGEYKAVLQVSYGPAGATLQDTAVFWVIPWQKILIIFGVLLGVIIVLSLILYRKYEKWHQKRLFAFPSILIEHPSMDPPAAPRARREDPYVLDLRNIRKPRS